MTGGAAAVLSSFDNNGTYPYGSLTLSGSTLYGMTSTGGGIFSIPVAGGAATTLFSFNGGNGQTPEADLTLSGGMLYGTATSGGTTATALFSASPRPAARQRSCRRSTAPTVPIPGPI